MTDQPAREGGDHVPGLLRVLTIGAVTVGLAAVPYKVFELDRFFVPKEAALELAAAAALVAVTAGRAAMVRATAADASSRSGTTPGVDLALAVFLVTSVASSAFAPSGWLAARALGISLAGISLYWVARAAARAGWSTAVLRAAALLPAAAVATALVQTYGLRTEYFSLNRAPGGTFGNRNFVAHLCAIGLPVLAYLAVRARRAPALAATTATFAAAAATLVLTRSRGAWLAAFAALVPFAIGLARAAIARSGAAPRTAGADRVRIRRAPVLLVAGAVAALAAVRLPNALDWRSDSPYLDSAREVVNYRGGSGQGRLKQWRNSARLVAESPVLGVGPGNWSVRYPAVAPPDDPSLTDERTTANPWPSSDWVAFASERGLLGAGALATALGLLFWRACGRLWRAPSVDERLRGATVAAVLAATLTAGAFDAVLMLAAPSFLAWTVLGALAGPAGSVGVPQADRPWIARVLALALVLAAAVSVAHGAAMGLLSTGRAGPLETAAVLAPGDYRIQLRASQVAQRTGRCDEARVRAAATHVLAPSATAPARVLRACPASRAASRSR